MGEVNVKNRLILIEGIPGSGKSTIASRLKDYLQNTGIKVKLYSEGDTHPADLAWNAVIQISDYEKLLIDYPKYAEIIRNNTQFEESYAIIAYIKLELGTEENELMSYFEAHEVYDGKVSLNTFKKLHLKRWEQFAKNIDDNSIIIFECSYLQNHINELMGFHNKDMEFIMDYMTDLIKTVERLSPKLIYLAQPNVHETIERVAKERVSPDKSKWQDWIDRVISYVETSQYGIKHNLKGFEGVVEFFNSRKEIELTVIKKLPMDKAIINNLEYNWNEVFNQVLSSLDMNFTCREN
jgi:adenylate kinase family enzyme